MFAYLLRQIVSSLDQTLEIFSDYPIDRKYDSRTYRRIYGRQTSTILSELLTLILPEILVVSVMRSFLNLFTSYGILDL